MNLESIWTWLRTLSDRWEFVGGLLVLVVLFNRIVRPQSYTSGLLLPVLLLFMRKLALYVPVSGTISTVDRVMFWLVDAYIYFFILMTIYALVIWGFGFRKTKIDWTEEGWPWFLLLYVGPLIGSGICLPVDGWSHLYMPVISLLGIFKILLVNPILLPLIWMGIFAQALLTLFARGASAREMNKLLLASLMIGGFVQFGFQIINFTQSATISEIRERWQTVNPGDKETKDFLGVWVERLPQLQKSGVNIIEKSAYPEGEMVKIVKTIPDVWDNLQPGGAVRQIIIISMIFFVLFWLIERIQWGDERDLSRERD